MSDFFYIEVSLKEAEKQINSGDICGCVEMYRCKNSDYYNNQSWFELDTPSHEKYIKLSDNYKYTIKVYNQ